LQALFEAPTIAELAELIIAMPHEKPDASTAIEVDPRNRFEKFPLTDVQQAFWIGRASGFARSGTAHSYNEVEIERLDLDRLELALRRVIERHDMLRMIVHPDGEQQVLEKVPPYCLAKADLSALTTADADTELANWRDRLSHQMLDTARWPLFEIGACILGANRVRLFFSFDLLVADAWSRRILVRDLIKFYADPNQVDTPLTLSFRDCVLAEKAAEGTEPYRRDLEYWQARLALLPEGPPLPMLTSIDPTGDTRFERWSRQLEAPAWNQLKARAAQAGVTPSVILLTAFADVLAAFSGQSHFTVNLTLFNRPELHAEINEIIGDFTSVNLLEVCFGTFDTFDKRARRLQEQLWSDLDHSQVGGVRVMRELARIGRGRTLVPVVFTSTLGLAANSAFPEPVSFVHAVSQTPQVVLDNQVSEDATGLRIAWDVVAARFPRGFVSTMFESYCELLRRLSGNEAAWQAVPQDLVPAPQLARRMDVNATAAALPQVRLHELFLSQVAGRRDHPAVVSSTVQLSYGDLEKSSARLAARLRTLDVCPGELVGIVMDKGWEQIVSVLAVLRAGAAYLPIDPALPSERITHLLSHGGVRFVFTQPWLEDTFALPDGTQCLCVEALHLEEGEARFEEWSEPSGSADEVAYVIYTSGSTGLPKGVVIDHRGAVNTVLEINRRWGIEATDRVLALSSLSFDLSVYDIFGPLAAGGTIVLPDISKTPDPAHWANMCEQHGVTIWNSVPALMELLVDHLLQADEIALPRLRLVLLSGDWIAVTLPDRVRSLIGKVNVVSLGGATEASIWSIGREVAGVDLGWSSIPYGRPLSNQKMFVLNDIGEECPEWVVGELYIGGVGVALGYWRDGGRTAERFVPNPYSYGERLYRTGDLGRWLPEGEIEFLGRADHQVKIRGYRIELGEIEVTLREFEGIKDVVVVAYEESPGDKRLVAYVAAEVEVRELRKHLERSLPEYMVPSTFVLLDALPLTPNGKIDRRALPAPHVDAVASGEYVAPRNATEEALVSIWREVLKHERIGIYDDFFELGGHSLLAMRVIARIREAFQVELPLRTLFEAPRVAQLAAFLPAEWEEEVIALEATA
jgi:amino acid adenylation domain-containing protein